MTGAELRDLRRRLDLRAADFARILGYGGATDVILSRQVYNLEGGHRPIPPCVELLALAYDAFGVPSRICVRVFGTPELPTAKRGGRRA